MTWLSAPEMAGERHQQEDAKGKVPNTGYLFHRPTITAPAAVHAVAYHLLYFYHLFT